MLAAHHSDGIGKLKSDRVCGDLATLEREVGSNVVDAFCLQLLLLILGVLAQETRYLEGAGD